MQSIIGASADRPLGPETGPECGKSSLHRMAAAVCPLLVVFVLILSHPPSAPGSAYDFLRLATPGTIFAIDPGLKHTKNQSQGPVEHMDNRRGMGGSATVFPY
jgi:hypothetical protein